MFCEGDKVYDEKGDCTVCNMHLEEITQDLVGNSHSSHSHSSHSHSSHSHHEAPKVTDDMAGRYYCPMFL